MIVELNVAEIKEIEYVWPSPARRGYHIKVELEEWRAEEMMAYLWDKFGDELFEKMIYGEGFKLVKHNDFTNKSLEPEQ